MGSVFDTWVGSWVFLLPPLKVNIQSSFFKAQHRDFIVTNLRRMAVVSVSVTRWVPRSHLVLITYRGICLTVFFLPHFYNKPAAVARTGMFVIFTPSYWANCQRQENSQSGDHELGITCSFYFYFFLQLCYRRYKLIGVSFL